MFKSKVMKSYNNTEYYIRPFYIKLHNERSQDVILYRAVQYSTVLWNIEECYTILYNTIQYNTRQYNTILCGTIQYNTIQYNTIQYNTIQYNNTIQ